MRTFSLTDEFFLAFFDSRLKWNSILQFLQFLFIFFRFVYFIRSFASRACHAILSITSNKTNDENWDWNHKIDVEMTKVEHRKSASHIEIKLKKTIIKRQHDRRSKMNEKNIYWTIKQIEMRNVMRKKEKFEKINEKTECDEYALSSTFDLLISNARKHQNSNKRMKLENHVFFQTISLRITSDFVIKKKDKTYQKHFKQYEKFKKIYIAKENSSFWLYQFENFFITVYNMINFYFILNSISIHWDNSWKRDLQFKIYLFFIEHSSRIIANHFRKFISCSYVCQLLCKLDSLKKTDLNVSMLYEFSRFSIRFMIYFISSTFSIDSWIDEHFWIYSRLDLILSSFEKDSSRRRIAWNKVILMTNRKMMKKWKLIEKRWWNDWMKKRKSIKIVCFDV